MINLFSLVGAVGLACLSGAQSLQPKSSYNTSLYFDLKENNDNASFTLSLSTDKGGFNAFEEEDYLPSNSGYTTYVYYLGFDTAGNVYNYSSHYGQYWLLPRYIPDYLTSNNSVPLLAYIDSFTFYHGYLKTFTRQYIYFDYFTDKVFTYGSRNYGGYADNSMYNLATSINMVNQAMEDDSIYGGFCLYTDCGYNGQYKLPSTEISGNTMACDYYNFVGYEGERIYDLNDNEFHMFYAPYFYMLWWEDCFYDFGNAQDLFSSSNAYTNNSYYGSQYSLERDTIQAYDSGYSAGYYQGNENGYNNGYQAGSQGGYQAGYTAGYNEAYDQDTTALTIFTGIVNIALLPVNFFLACLNFEVFGINIGAFVSALLTIAVVVIIIKTITGKKND